MIDINQTARYIIVATIIVTDQQECRGHSPLSGFGLSPKPLISPPQAARKR